MTEELKNYIDSKFGNIIESLLEDSHVELLKLFLFDTNKYRHELIRKICIVIRQNDNTSYSEDDVLSYLKNFFSIDENMSRFYFELGDVLTRKIFNDPDYAGKTDEQQLMAFIHTRVFWSLFPKAVKKCLSRNLYSATVNSNLISGYQHGVVEKCVAGFNIDAATYSRTSESGLHLFLHKRYYSKKIRTQKKNVSRVRRQIRKIIMLYKSKYPAGRAFIKGLDNLPDDFIRAVRRIYF